MTMQLKYKRYSGAERVRVPVTPSLLPNYLFTCTMCFFRMALSARPYRWHKKTVRGIIHVGVNTLSRVYNMKNKMIITAKVIPVVLVLWVITFIIQNS